MRRLSRLLSHPCILALMLACAVLCAVPCFVLVGPATCPGRLYAFALARAGPGPAPSSVQTFCCSFATSLHCLVAGFLVVKCKIAHRTWGRSMKRALHKCMEKLRQPGPSEGKSSTQASPLSLPLDSWTRSSGPRPRRPSALSLSGGCATIPAAAPLLPAEGTAAAPRSMSRRPT